MAAHRILDYIGMGYKLIPLEPGGKRPLARLVPEGLKNASSDRGVIERWQASAPTANWGILPPESVLILDVDDPEIIGGLLASYPALAEAPCQRTPRGGAHIFLSLPKAYNIRATTRAIAGCDLRGLGKAYVVAAPSVIGGKRYAWERPLLPPDKLPLVPEALLERLLPQQKPTPPAAPASSAANPRLAGLLDWAAREVAATPPGERHNTLLRLSRLVGGWLHHGLALEEALEALVRAAQEAGLPEGEARATAKDGLEFGARDPLPLPPDDNPLTPRHVHPLEGLSGGGTVLDGAPRYIVKGGAIQAARVDGRAASYWPLANFACVIKREIRATDGLESDMLFELDGYLADGRPLPRAVVRAAEFAGMGWVAREWGAAAIVAPGQGARDQLRAAIQYLSSGRIERANVYKHLGWAQIAGRWHFLHAGGAIAAESPKKVEVHPGRSLEGFSLPEPPREEEEPRLISAVWALREVAPGAVALLLYALGAPLGHAPYSLYMAGPTGTRKTSLALVAQSFFGCATQPPLGWEATANALEGAAFGAKDCLLLIDDYAPTGNERAQKELQAKAARLLRSQGNAVGRLRMRADGSLAGDRPPRGSLLITGEDLPPGHSVRARTLFLEVRPGDINLERLSEAQRLARSGVYAAAMAAWIRHLAGRLEEFQAWVAERVEELRPRWAAAHGRTTDALARLQATWELYAEYAALRGVDLTANETEVMAVLAAIGDAQSSYQQDADPAERFRRLLQAALQMGRCHIAPLNGEPTDPVDAHLDNPAAWGWQYRQAGSDFGKGTWLPQGPRIGWAPADWGQRGIFLEPTAAWATLNRLAAEQGEPLPSERTLWKRLAELGAIRTEKEGEKVRFQVRLQIHGNRVRVVHFRLSPL